jgi:ABC-type bacteriocin/lantibiotic exporter with double-glycine peptidase domain
MQILIAVLDLVGLALLMRFIMGIQNFGTYQTNPSRPSSVFLGNLFLKADTNLLLGIVLVIFIFKGVLALSLHSLNIRILSSETIHLVKRLAKIVFAARNSQYKKLSSQDITYAIFNSTEMVFRDTLVPVTVILADSVLIFLVFINLIINAKVLFIPTFIYFLIIFIFMRKREKNKTKSMYRIQWETEVKGRSQLQETLASLRELYVSTKLVKILNKIVASRSEFINASGAVALSQLRPKYFYEMALFGGIGIMALVSKVSRNQELILTFLVLFTVSASRMIPSFMRIQYYLGIFLKSKEQTVKIFQILETNKLSEEQIVDRLCLPNSMKAKSSFVPEILVENVSFYYDFNNNRPTLDQLNLKVSAGEAIAIVGPSGSGKSTLIDIILGINTPNLGYIKISGYEPRKCFSMWPGEVAYVPQKVTLYEGTLFENIAVSTESSDLATDRRRAESLLENLDMGAFLKTQKNGIDSPISEFGANLSGGQAQRIGIARALFSNPKLLVLDETTSSLDSLTENTVMKFIDSFKGETTLVIVAHRLSTIKTCDRIYYLEDGKIAAQGSFDQIRDAVPNFETQVKLLNI